MNAKTSQPGAVDRELGARRLLALIDEVQERLVQIREQADQLIETTKASCNGVHHA